MRCAEVRLGGSQRLRVAVGEQHHGAFRGEASGSGQSDPGSSAGDQRDSAG